MVKLGQINELKQTSSKTLSSELDEMHLSNDSTVSMPQREQENAHAKMISKRIRRRLEGREHLQTIDDSFSHMNMAKLARRQTLDAPMCQEGPEQQVTEQVITSISL